MTEIGSCWPRDETRFLAIALVARVFFAELMSPPVSSNSSTLAGTRRTLRASWRTILENEKIVQFDRRIEVAIKIVSRDRNLNFFDVDLDRFLLIFSRYFFARIRIRRCRA